MRVVVVADPAVGVSANDLAAEWMADGEARALAAASVETPPPGQFFPGVVEFLVLPFVVNVASDVVSDLIRRLVGRIRRDRGEPTVELELVESVGADGARIVVACAQRSDQ